MNRRVIRCSSGFEGALRDPRDLLWKTSDLLYSVQTSCKGLSPPQHLRTPRPPKGRLRRLKSPVGGPGSDPTPPISLTLTTRWCPTFTLIQPETHQPLGFSAQLHPRKIWIGIRSDSTHWTLFTVEPNQGYDYATLFSQTELNRNEVPQHSLERRRKIFDSSFF